MDLVLPIIFAIIPIVGSCYRVIDSSNIQEHFFICLKNFYHAMKKKKHKQKKITRK